MWRPRIATIGLGGVAALGQAPQDWWFLTIAALAIFAMRPVFGTNKQAFWSGWLFGFGYFLVALRWIVSPFLVDLAQTGWMAPFAALAMAGGLALFWGAASLLAYRLAPRSPAIILLALAAAEMARSLIMSGFPWALLGHVWLETPLVQLSAFIGPHGLSLLTAMTTWAVIAISQRRLLIGAVCLLAFAGGWVGLAPPAQQIDVTAPTIRLVQPNAAQADKWDPVKAPQFFDRMLTFSAAAPRPDLIVWPETAVSYLLDEAGPEFNRIKETVGGVPLITGINRREGLRFYNSLVLVSGDGDVTDVYDKAHIVPFGEFIPGGELLARIGIGGLAASQGQAFSSGAGPALIQIPGIGAARPLICYEGIFSEEIDAGDQPRLMVLITNDAWFGPNAGPRQHLAQARLRAIEQGVPMVRVANTGISAMIDAYGRVIAHIGMGQAAMLDVALPPKRPATLYGRFGDIPAAMLLLLCLLFARTAGRRSNMLTGTS